MDREFPTASQAREKADSSDCLKNRVYRCINDAAKENITTIRWAVRDLSEKAVADLKARLSKDGYSIDCERFYDDSGNEIGSDEDSLIIKW